MDHDLIYAKTASGEGAMLQRTRVMQRNVRMVLILVDSRSSVADLCLKTGNPQLTENALQELEKGGFIEPRGKTGSKDSTDSMWAEGRKVAQEIRAAAKSYRRIQLVRVASTSKEVSEQSVPDVAISADAVTKTTAPSNFSISKTSLASAQSEQVFPLLRAETGMGHEIDGQSQFPTVSAPSFTERVKALFLRQNLHINKAEPIFVESLRPFPPTEDQGTEESKNPFAERFRVRVSKPIWVTGQTIRLKPIRRDQAESIGRPVIIILGVACALTVAFVSVLLFPYSNYLPELEVAFSNASGRPVKVGTMHLNVYPQPSMVLGDVRIGAGKGELRVNEIRLHPAIGTLMAAKIIFREVVASDVSLPVEMIAGLPSIFVGLSNPDSRFGVTHISLEKAAISFAGLGFSNMDGEVVLSADGLLQSFRLRSADHSLSLQATPRALGLDVVLEGYGWRPAQGSAFIFDSLNLNAIFSDGVVTIKNMELRIFEGVIEGAAVLRSDQRPSVVGKVSIKRINATRFGDAIGLGQQFNGETAGKIHFSTKAESWASIFSAIDADGDFTVQRGSIRGLDLTEAARSDSKTPIQGGETRFENLSGVLKLTPTRYQFSGLVLNSGLIQSTGYLDISRELTVSGKMELRMRGTVNQTRVPISISGPLKSPTVQAGGGG